MTRARRRPVARECFYCDGLIAGKGEADHFPIPQRHGGTETVPCCQSCHDMKDRFVTDDWSMAWWSVVVGAWPRLLWEIRIFIAKACCVLQDATRTRSRP